MWPQNINSSTQNTNLRARNVNFCTRNINLCARSRDSRISKSSTPSPQSAIPNTQGMELPIDVPKVSVICSDVVVDILSYLSSYLIKHMFDSSLKWVEYLLRLTLFTNFVISFCYSTCFVMLIWRKHIFCSSPPHTSGENTFTGKLRVCRPSTKRGKLTIRPEFSGNEYVSPLTWLAHHVNV